MARAATALILLAALGATAGGPAQAARPAWRVLPPALPGWLRGDAARRAIAQGTAPVGAQALARGRAMRTLNTAAGAFPVYPGSRPSGGATPGGSMALIPATPYAIDIWRLWSAPAGMLAVRDWLEAASARDGWAHDGESPLGRIATPMVAERLGLTFWRGRPGDTPTISVTLAPAGGAASLLAVLGPPNRGPTLVRYDAMTVWTPPRPRASLVPADAVEVDVRVTVPGATPGLPSRTATATVRDRADIQRLAAQVNALPMDNREMGCLPGGPGQLTFRRASGTPVTVQVDDACAQLTVDGTYQLVDLKQAMWPAVLALAGVQPPQG